MKNKIDRFNGVHFYLSNFYICDIEMNGIIYPSIEHAFQAAKTDNMVSKEKIRKAATPGLAKAIGNQVMLRVDWGRVRLYIMEILVIEKFQYHPDLALKLKQTGDAELIEGNNWHDIYWGVCNGMGQNHLGKILMKIREELE